MWQASRARSRRAMQRGAGGKTLALEWVAGSVLAIVPRGWKLLFSWAMSSREREARHGRCGGLGDWRTGDWAERGAGKCRLCDCCWVRLAGGARGLDVVPEEDAEGRPGNRCDGWQAAGGRAVGGQTPGDRLGTARLVCVVSKTSPSGDNHFNRPPCCKPLGLAHPHSTRPPWTLFLLTTSSNQQDRLVYFNCMAANAAEEAAYLDGTHPALQGNAQAHTTLRAGSPELHSQRDDDHSPPASPRFSAVDDDPPAPAPAPVNAPARGGGASNTGPKGVLADWHAANSTGATHTGPKGVLADWRSNQASQAASGLTQISLDDVRELGLDEDHLRDAVVEVGRDEARGEEAAREAYRRKRMAEMSGSGQREARARNKVFGHLREIGFDQFLPAVEEEEASVAVILHLYEPVSCQLSVPLSSSCRSLGLTRPARLAGDRGLQRAQRAPLGPRAPVPGRKVSARHGRRARLCSRRRIRDAPDRARVPGRGSRDDHGPDRPGLGSRHPGRGGGHTEGVSRLPFFSLPPGRAQ